MIKAEKINTTNSTGVTRQIFIKKSEEQKDLAAILAHAITGGDYEEYILKNNLTN